MKRIFLLGILVLTGLLLHSCITKKPVIDSRVTVLPLGDSVFVTEGSLVYALPMTVFDIIVDFERTIEKPGPYAKFAGEMLGIRDVITSESESWAITGIRIRTGEEIDPSEFYVIESSSIVQFNALALKKSGLILDINPSTYEKETDADTGDTEEDFSGLRFLDLGADEYYVSLSDTAFRIVKLDTAFIRIPYLVERKKQLGIEQLAEMAARTLLELREGKHYILTGETNIFPQSGAAIEEMNRLEGEYLALFAGKTLRTKKSVRYTVIPRKEMEGSAYTLFRFSDLIGPASLSSEFGTPVTINFIPANKTKDITVIRRPVSEDEPVSYADKLYYRLPDVVTVNINMGNQNFYSARKLIYQFGSIVQIPANYIIGK